MKNVTTAVHQLPVPRCDRQWERDNRYAPAIVAEGPVVTCFLGGRTAWNTLHI
ncbi:MAG: hypothetical protein AB4352_24910 [Hormoscilla sp.]